MRTPSKEFSSLFYVSNSNFKNIKKIGIIQATNQHKESKHEQESIPKVYKLSKKKPTDF
jgi:hypothetical protein